MRQVIILLDLLMEIKFDFNYLFVDFDIDPFKKRMVIMIEEDTFVVSKHHYIPPNFTMESYEYKFNELKHHSSNFTMDSYEYNFKELMYLLFRFMYFYPHINIQTRASLKDSIPLRKLYLDKFIPGHGIKANTKERLKLIKKYKIY